MKSVYQKFICILLTVIMVQSIIFQGASTAHAETYTCGNLPLNDGIVYECNNSPLNAGGTEGHYEDIVCSPYTGSICNICGGNLANCGHKVGTTYGGTVCSPHTVSTCNICGGDSATCGHKSGTTYGGTVCDPSDSICNICNGISPQCGHTSGNTYGGTVCDPSDRICNICNGIFPQCGHNYGYTYGGTVCDPSDRICNICNGIFPQCGHNYGYTYGGTICSPSTSICNICHNDYYSSACSHSAGQTYGGTVCSTYSVSICNICGGNYATCPHSAGTTYGGRVCSPSGGICNICGGNYATCPHYAGTTYGGTVCSPYSVSYCNICNGRYSSCPHSVGTTYGGTVCSPSTRICNICHGNFANCGHTAGTTYGGTVCSPSASICNICNQNSANCSHTPGTTYGGTVCSPSVSICNICNQNSANCNHIPGTTYGGTVCSPSASICNICNQNSANCNHIPGTTYGGTVCSPRPQICNICSQNFPNCGHKAGLIYGGTVCSPYDVSYCNICNGIFPQCGHMYGYTYGGTECSAHAGNICNICSNPYGSSVCSHSVGQTYGRTWIPATPNTYHVHDSLCAHHYTTHTHTSECVGANNPEYQVKQRLITILKGYPGYNDVNDNFSFDDIVYKFLYWYAQYHQGQYLEATYSALLPSYRLTALDHWASMVEQQYDQGRFYSNLLPASYYESIPDAPTSDSSLAGGAITKENKYQSIAAKNYYVQYYYPIDAFNEIGYKNYPEEVKTTCFRDWARFTYGSSASEQGEEFATGVLMGLTACPFKTALDTIEGTFSFFRNCSQLPALITFLAKATVYSDYREALVMMINQAVDEWKTEYNNADPVDKGIMIGDLIGQVLTAVVGTAQTAQGIKAFIKGGGFLNAFRGAVQAVRRIKTAIGNPLDELSGLITKFYSKADDLIEVEYAGVGRMKFKESELIEDADIIGQQRYKNYMENKYVESPEGASLTDDAAEKLMDGQQYTTNGRIKVLKPNVTYASNGYTYQTDHLGRVTKASGKLQLKEATRNDYAQRVVGRIDRRTSDQGGHLIGSRFNGSGNLDNLVPMDANLNLSAWKTMENTWADALAKGKTVTVEIQPIYQGVSQRPTDFIVDYDIDGQLTRMTFENR